MADHGHPEHTVTQASMYQELGDLARYLERTVRSLQELEHPIKDSSSELPKATEHLHDLVKMTEDGTHQVMTLTESIQDRHPLALERLARIRRAVAAAGWADGGLLGDVDALEQMITQEDQALMEIMTALSFQDLVGQKIKKLVTILDDVQRKLVQMVVVFGAQQGPAGAPAGASRNGEAQQMIKELEASKTTALKQDLVDDILGKFGFA